MIKDSLTIFKAWMTLHTCASGQGIVLDLVLCLGFKSFIKSFQWFFGRSGCLSYVISDGGSNFVVSERQNL